MSTTTNVSQSQMAPVSRTVRAYAAPINRVSGGTICFDPAAQGDFDLDAPPPLWLDLGWIENLQRSGKTKYEAVRTGSIASITGQYRAMPDAQVEFDLLTWGKVQLSLSGGTQQMNVLAEEPDNPPQPSGGTAVVGSPVQAGSSLTEIVLTPDQVAIYNACDIVAVDEDYSGETGYLGTWAAGSYLREPLSGVRFIDLVRRVTFNVARVSGKTATSLQLAEPLITAPTSSMSVQKVVAFVDREGSSFFQEWSLLLVVAPDSGGRTCFYYPRMQASASASESRQEIASSIFSHRLHVSLRAMPTTDKNDNETVLCYRSYFPPTNAGI